MKNFNIVDEYILVKNRSKIKYIVLIIIQLVILFSCNNVTKENNLAHDNNVTNEKIVSTKIDYKYYDVYGLGPAKVIFPKNQTIAQGLSVLVNDEHGNLIVFDGGRVEDADYLCDIIKDNGGVVKTWFITHIHDDHIGALYKILSDKRSDIEIKELYYDFADFDWYYSKMGNDAGIYYLFINAIASSIFSTPNLHAASNSFTNTSESFLFATHAANTNGRWNALYHSFAKSYTYKKFEALFNARSPIITLAEPSSAVS